MKIKGLEMAIRKDLMNLISISFAQILLTVFQSLRLHILPIEPFDVYSNSWVEGLIKPENNYLVPKEMYQCTVDLFTSLESAACMLKLSTD